MDDIDADGGGGDDDNIIELNALRHRFRRLKIMENILSNASSGHSVVCLA